MYFYADIVYVHAKIHALYGDLFRKKEYVDLINSGNFNALSPHLKLTFQKSLYIDAKEILFKNQIEKLLILIDANKEYRDLFIAFLSIFERNNIKLLLSKAFGREFLIEQWNDIGPYKIVNKKLLNEDFTLDYFYKCIKNSYLGPILIEDEEPRYEIIESRLDFTIISRIFKYSQRLSKSKKNIFQDLMIRRLLITYITWQYRLQTSYKWPKERIEEHLQELYTGVAGELNDFKLYNSIELEIEKIISHQFKGKQISEDYGIDELEKHLELYFFRYLKKNFNRDFHQIYSVVSYLWLLTYQIQNLFSIVEGMRFGVGSEIILKKLIVED